MKVLINIICIIIISSFLRATFSIVAVDKNTGEVGSAGGSCIAGSIIISDIHPGVGAIHTQSYWNGVNQNNASEQMDLGASPDEIIDYLVNNDVANNPSIRQYGVVDLGLLNSGRSAAFTGENCYDYKGHILGDTYAIQGNILLGSEVLENMEDQFLNTEGDLSEKLMASLQGANIPGADTRCLDDSLSSLSAFIRVAKPMDFDEYYLDLNVNNIQSINYHIDPIDSLQIVYNEWYLDNIDYILGDVNQDLNIDILDVILVINIILDLHDPQIIEILSSDINEDGIINIQDIIILLAIILDD